MAGEAPGFSFSRAASLAGGPRPSGLFLFRIIDPDHPSPRAVMPLRYPAIINGRIRSGCERRSHLSASLPPDSPSASSPGAPYCRVQPRPSPQASCSSHALSFSSGRAVAARVSSRAAAAGGRWARHKRSLSASSSACSSPFSVRCIIRVWQRPHQCPKKQRWQTIQLKKFFAMHLRCCRTLFTPARSIQEPVPLHG